MLNSGSFGGFPKGLGVRVRGLGVICSQAPRQVPQLREPEGLEQMYPTHDDLTSPDLRPSISTPSALAPELSTLTPKPHSRRPRGRLRRH